MIKEVSRGPLLDHSLILDLSTPEALHLFAGRKQLIQLALSLAGLPSPHFTDQQRRLGSAVPDLAPSRRGDLVFGEEGGGGLMIDDLLMIHASRAAGKVTVAPAASLGTLIRRRF